MTPEEIKDYARRLNANHPGFSSEASWRVIIREDIKQQGAAKTRRDIEEILGAENTASPGKSAM